MWGQFPRDFVHTSVKECAWCQSVADFGGCAFRFSDVLTKECLLPGICSALLRGSVGLVPPLDLGKAAVAQMDPVSIRIISCWSQYRHCSNARATQYLQICLPRCDELPTAQPLPGRCDHGQRRVGFCFGVRWTSN